MKFTVINDLQGSIYYRGYQFPLNSSSVINNELYSKLEQTRGEMFVENEKDDFYDGCFNPICKSDDGKLYAVQFVYDDDTYKPLIWQEVEKLNSDTCSIKQARTFAGLTQQDMSDTLGIPKRTIENWEVGSRVPSEWVAKLVKKELFNIGEQKLKSLEHCTPFNESVFLC